MDSDFPNGQQTLGKIGRTFKSQRCRQHANSTDTLSDAFVHFLSSSFHKGVIRQLKA
jgi:hypothetical protein